MKILATILLLTALVPHGVMSVQKKKRVVLLKTMPVRVVINHSNSFVRQLEQLGYRHGESIELIEYDANGDRDRAESFLIGILNQSPPDLVVTSATLASQAAHKVLRNTGVPMVFFTVSDPVGVGLIKKIGIPTGTNVTGRVHMLDRQTKINVAMRLIGGGNEMPPVRFGIIHSTYPSAMGDVRELKKIARTRKDLQFIVRRITYRKVPKGLTTMISDVIKAIAEIEQSVDFWWEVSGPLAETKEYRHALQGNSDKAIAMGLTTHAAEMGALVALSPNESSSGIEAAHLAASILKGADPGKIAVTEPAEFDLAINLGTALRLGIVIPPDIMKLAGDNIYQ